MKRPTNLLSKVVTVLLFIGTVAVLSIAGAAAVLGELDTSSGAFVMLIVGAAFLLAGLALDEARKTAQARKRPRGATPNRK